MAYYHNKYTFSIINDSFRLMFDIFEYCIIIYIFDKFIKKMEQVMKKIILSIMLTFIMGACNMNE